MNYKTTLTSVIFSAFTVFSMPCLTAAQESECAERLRECFTHSETARDMCFQSTARTASCKDSSEGRLAAKRGAYSSFLASEAPEDGAEVPERVLFDPECVDNFDNLWLSHLVNSDHSLATCENLAETLAACETQAAPEMWRP